MKYFGLIAVTLLLLIIGCGGGGGSATTSTATTTTTATTGTSAGNAPLTYLLAKNSAGEIVDPTNLIPGEVVTFVVVQVAPGTYAPTFETSGNFTTTDSNSSAGTLVASTGVYTATTAQPGKTFTVSTVFSGSTYSAVYSVSVPLATVTGTVIDSNSTPIPFAQILFFDNTQTQVAAAYAGLDGTFTANVPVTAERFDIAPGSLPSNANSTTIPSSAYIKYFTYGSGTYNPLSFACAAPVPVLTDSTVTALPSQIVVLAAATLGGVPNTPPPPPNCTP